MKLQSTGNLGADLNSVIMTYDCLSYRIWCWVEDQIVAGDLLTDIVVHFENSSELA